MRKGMTMLPGMFFFMTGACLGFAWGWATGREFPNGPLGRG